MEFHHCLPVACVILDGRGRILDLNAAAARLLRRPHRELLASSFRSLVCPADGKVFARHLQTCGKRRRQGFLEVALIRPAAEPVQVQLVSLPDSRHGFRPRRHLTLIHDVTRHKRVEEALRQSEARFQTLADNVPALFSYIGADLRYRYVNRYYEALFSRSASRIIGHRVKDVVGKAIYAVSLPHMRKALAGEQVSYEAEFQIPTGPRFLEVAYTPDFGPGGKVQGLFSLVHDVTARRQAERALRESQEDLNRAQAVAHTGSWRSDIRRNEIHWSDETYRMFGVPRGTPMTHETFLAMVHPEDRSRVDKAWQAALRDAPYDLEHRIVVEGQVKWVRELAELEFDPRGRLRGGFGIVQDITARKQAEEALRRSEAKYRRLVEGLKDEYLFYRHDTAGRFTYVSPSVTNILGYTPDEFQVRYTEILTDAPLNQEVIRRTEQAMRGIRQPPYEVEVRHKDGAPHRLEVSEGPLFDAEGKVVAVEGIAHDITARKQAEARLRLQSTALEAAANGIVLTDRNGVIRWVNPAFSRMTGYATDEVLGRKPSLLKSGRHDPAFYRDMWASILRGEVWRGELVNRRKDGSLYSEEMTITPVPDGQGRIGHFIAIKQDITARRAAEEALRESQQRYRAIFSLAPSGVVLIEPEHGRIAEFNEQACAMLGYSREEFSQFSIPDLEATEQREEVEQHLQRIMQFGRDGFESRLWAKDGHGVDIIVTACGVQIEGRPHILAVWNDITERKQAEQALRQSEERYRLLADNAEDLVALNHADGRRLYVSPSHFRVTGWPPEEIRATDWRSRLHPEDRPAVEQARAANLRGESTLLEHRVLCKDGAWKWLETRCGPVVGSDSKVEKMVVWSRDITERKRAEEALKASESALKQAQLLAGIGNWEWDVRTGQHAWSGEIYRMYGRDPSRPPAAYPEVKQYFTPESWTRLAAAVEKALAEGVPYECDAEVVRPDGSHRWVTARGQAVRDADGSIVSLHGTVQDITVRKQAEEALRESEERFRLMVMTVSDYAIYLVDADGRIVSWNAGAQRITGHESGEIIGRHVSAFYPPEDEARGRPLHDLAQVRSEGHTEIEHWRVRKNGSRFWANVTTTALWNEQGQLRAFAQIIRDLTDRQRLEAAVSAVAEAEKKRIAGDLHDGLGQQLSGLGFLAEGLRRDLAEQPGLANRVGEFCRLLEDAAAQTRVLVHGLYAVPPTVDGLLVALGNLAAGVRRESRVQCRFRCDTAALIQDAVVATHLYRIAQEAVHNALKHSRASRIHLGLRTLKHSLELVVRDNGVGLPLKPRSGLGLQSMRHRAAQIGAELMVRNSHRGAEVVCHVPLAVLRVPSKRGAEL